MSIDIHIGPKVIYYTIITLWLFIGFILRDKQEEVAGGDSLIVGIVIIMFAPIWLIGAIVRQVFIEKWK